MSTNGWRTDDFGQGPRSHWKSPAEHVTVVRVDKANAAHPAKIKAASPAPSAMAMCRPSANAKTPTPAPKAEVKASCIGSALRGFRMPPVPSGAAVQRSDVGFSDMVAVFLRDAL
jgi:hypothetical protein